MAVVYIPFNVGLSNLALLVLPLCLASTVSSIVPVPMPAALTGAVPKGWENQIGHNRLSFLTPQAHAVADVPLQTSDACFRTAALAFVVKVSCSGW